MEIPKTELMETKVAVVILNWNGERLLKQFLPSVIAHTILLDGVKLIVADNASMDGSVKLLQTEYPQVQIISLEQNYGFAEGYNRALSQVNAEYFVLLNSDVEVTKGWLQPMLQYMETNTHVGACQPKLLSYSNKKMFEYAGASGGFIDKYGYPFCRGRVLKSIEEDSGQYDSPMEVFWATGACMMVRSEAYKYVGGLDSEFFAHMEEIDLCWRMKSRGYRIVCIPQSVVYHLGGGTLSSESPRKTFLNFRNSLLMLYKNVPETDLPDVMNVRKVLDSLAILRFMLEGKVQNAKAIYMARKEFKTIVHKFRNKRLENIRYTEYENFDQMYNGSMILSYYLQGKKTFNRFLGRLMGS